MTLRSPSRRTVASPVAFSGRGIHTGQLATLEVLPDDSGRGLWFDCDGGEIPVRPEHLKGGRRSTDLGRDGALAKTVEHFLAACAGLGLTDARLKLRGPEVPGLDGSALEFSMGLRDSGLRDIPGGWEAIVLKEALVVEDGESRITAEPSEASVLEYHLSYPEYEVLASQTACFDRGSDEFMDKVAPARTFCLEEELEALKRAGLAQGGSLDVAVVVGKSGYLNPSLKMNQEPCWHKLLDLMGDLAVLGRPLRAKVVAEKSGHALNGRLVKALDALSPA